jgi:hypothetical protein
MINMIGKKTQTNNALFIFLLEHQTRILFRTILARIICWFTFTAIAKPCLSKFSIIFEIRHNFPYVYHGKYWNIRIYRYLHGTGTRVQIVRLVVQKRTFPFSTNGKTMSAIGTNIGSSMHRNPTVLLPRPIIIDDVQDIENHPLYCSICCDIAIIHPVTTPCNHIFCLSCITQGLQRNLICPNDRISLSMNQLHPISGAHQYIHDRILLRCPKCSQWNGKFQQYKEHANSCTSSPYVQELEQNLKDSDLLVEKLEQKMKDSDLLVEKLEQKLNDSDLLVKKLTDEKRLMTESIQSMQTTIDEYKSKSTFDASYGYDRNRVVELSQLICRYLESKPLKIDANRIFNCVKLIYDNLVQGWDDNPKYYSMDVLRLLSICKSSLWFTPNQHNRIKEWLDNYGW